jgi:hypothetical protein
MRRKNPIGGRIIQDAWGILWAGHIIKVGYHKIMHLFGYHHWIYKRKFVRYCALCDKEQNVVNDKWTDIS